MTTLLGLNKPVKFTEGTALPLLSKVKLSPCAYATLPPALAQLTELTSQEEFAAPSQVRLRGDLTVSVAAPSLVAVP
jgi:hypothetical protein